MSRFPNVPEPIRHAVDEIWAVSSRRLHEIPQIPVPADLYALFVPVAEAAVPSTRNEHGLVKILPHGLPRRE
ncbi:unnamed protein product [Caenorhabditis sp. 36 PRJEB53466]|nr:unnamed protein product [Caenorhabditis sp. 36 PRJEB53466]